MPESDNTQPLHEEAVLKVLHDVIEPDYGEDLVSLEMVDQLSVEGRRVAITVSTPTFYYAHKDAVAEACRAVLKSAMPELESVAVTFTPHVQADSRIQQKLNTPIKNIIAVASGKGGVGKSTVSVNLAVGLALDGARVGLLDADVYGPNIPMMMGVEEMPPVQQGKLIPAEAYGVHFMSMGFLMPADQALIWRGPMLHKAIQQLFTDVRWGELDYLVVDLPPGTGDAQLSLAQTAPLTGGIIVTMPQMVSVADARRGAAAFQQLDVPILGVVENMSGDIFGQGGGESAAKELGVDYLGRIELDAAVREGGDSGEPIVIAGPESPAAHSLRDLARTVATRVGHLNRQAGPELKIV